MLLVSKLWLIRLKVYQRTVIIFYAGILLFYNCNFVLTEHNTMEQLLQKLEHLETLTVPEDEHNEVYESNFRLFVISHFSVFFFFLFFIDFSYVLLYIFCTLYSVLHCHHQLNDPLLSY